MTDRDLTDRKQTADVAAPVPAVAEPTHVYLSTHCYHGLHDVCGAAQHARGDTGPPHCKNCPAECICPRHLDPAAPCIGGDQARRHHPSCARPDDDSHLGWCGPAMDEAEPEADGGDDHGDR